MVNVSDSTTPNILPASATHIASGAVGLCPADSTVVAYVAAKQTLMAAPIVTVKNTAADDTSIPSGAYTLALPVAAPLLGRYYDTPADYAGRAVRRCGPDTSKPRRLAIRPNNPLARIYPPPT